MQRIIYTNETGGVSIMTPTKKYVGKLTELVRKDLPAGVADYSIVEDDAIPEDKRYRDAWVRSGKVITVDMPKARAIYLERVRAERDAKLVSLDVETIKAVGSGDSAKVAEVEAQKQTLRDLPATLAVQLEACATVAEMDALTVKI